jgi:hypothetical protein
MTDQSSEVLKVGDETLYIREVRPLEHYFPEFKNTARAHWKLVPTYTSENRGYGGTWGIKNNALYLVSIDACRKKVTGFWFWKKVTFPEVTVSDLFPEAVNGEVKATWFTGGFSAHTKTMSNPVDDRLLVRFEQGHVVHHQWFHRDRSDPKNDIPYDRPLAP